MQGLSQREMKSIVNIAVGLISTTILALFVFGVGCSLTVHFSYVPVTLSAAAGSLANLRLGQLLAARLTWFLLPALVLTVLFCVTRRRLLFAVVCLCLPVLWLDWSRADAQLVALPFIAVSTTAGALAGRLDGETWAEGFVALAAMGFWSTMWLFVIFLEIWRDNKAIQATLDSRRKLRLPSASDG
jgi:hypothetical protein